MRKAFGQQKLNFHDLAEISNEKGTKLDSLQKLVRQTLGGQMRLGQEGLRFLLTLLHCIEHLS